MKKNNGFLEKLIAAALFASLTLFAGCGGGGGTTATTPGSGTISGTAIKGPVSGAAIKAFGMNSDGTKGGQIGTTTTDAQGNFSMDVGNYAGPFMLQMTGGGFTDEATGTVMTMGAGDMMTALVPSMTAGENVTDIQITPLTSMAQQMARNMSGGMTEANITQANSAMGRYFGVNDILHIQPMNPLANGAGAAATQDQRDYGMSIAAMSQYAHMVGMPNTSGMVTAMMNDASDGHMNGMMGGSQITMGGGMMGGGGMMQPNSGTSGLADAMQAFIQSGQNHSGLTFQDMQALMTKLGSSNGAIQ
ncbi:MAG: hypothetical protein M0Z71_11075 [Nitrospiraceae bacterium]|nr:hypothetical protein [Nitrospiraceae bacterium]